MADPNQRRYKKLYASEFKEAEELLVKNFGGSLEWVTHDYQAFQYKNDGVCLVFYPHRTSARNHHIRVRDQASKDKRRAQAIMNSLQFLKPLGCTFGQTNNHVRYHLKEAQVQEEFRIAKGMNNG